MVTSVVPVWLTIQQPHLSLKPGYVIRILVGNSCRYGTILTMHGRRIVIESPDYRVYEFDLSSPHVEVQVPIGQLER